LSKALSTDTWQRRGFSILWGEGALASLIEPAEALTLRQLFALSQEWPESLPSAGGDAVVAVGLQAVLDSLDPEAGQRWLDESLRPLLSSFQSEYGSEAALVLWVPGGRSRLVAQSSADHYLWRCHPGDATLPLGRLLWSGAESEVRRILDPAVPDQDWDGPAWIGLHHPRVS
jgi:hypothetical protein